MFPEVVYSSESTESVASVPLSASVFELSLSDDASMSELYPLELLFTYSSPLLADSEVPAAREPLCNSSSPSSASDDSGLPTEGVRISPVVRAVLASSKALAFCAAYLKTQKPHHKLCVRSGD